MHNVQKPYRILIITNEKATQSALSFILEEAGYSLLTADRVEQALLLAEQAPNIILLSSAMASIAQQLQKKPQLIYTPIIFLINNDEPITADTDWQAASYDYPNYDYPSYDYLRIPLIKNELLARLDFHLRLHDSLYEIERLRQIAPDAHPLTQLPGHNAINQALHKAIDENQRVAVIYCDIDNFKAFNDNYGFSRGDEIIKFTAETFQQALQTHCAEQGFLGHTGGDDFVLIIPFMTTDKVTETIFSRFEREIKHFYDPRDQQLGYISAQDRHGNMRRYSMLTLSLAGVDLPRSYCRHPGDINSVCADVQKYVKAISGNSFLLERRADVDGYS